MTTEKPLSAPVESVVSTWRAQRMSCQSDRHTFNSEVIDETGERVATILRERDAKLIAKAPTMQELLRRVAGLLAVPVVRETAARYGGDYLASEVRELLESC